mmetsp:Transcript_1346/g.3417  ORF Transcript_1346/g.3417 Transcript_1346/m.3417 type:complete len:1179 (-) Transcript_1346:299-3835(-)
MFIYLNKKIAIPNGIKLRCCQWNADQGWIACGGESGLLKVLKLESTGKGKERGIAGSSNLTMNQTLEGHQEAVVCAAWNEVYKKLTTSDQNGLIIVWMLHRGMWFEEMINNRNKSMVKDMKWTADGMKICIVYEDGAVIVGSVDGNRLWGKELKMQLQFVEWSPTGKQILFGTPQGELHIYDQMGNYVNKVPLFSDDPTAKIAGLMWYNMVEGLVDPQAPTLAIGFDNGRVQMMVSEDDEKPILIDTGLRTPQDKPGLYGMPVLWNSNGSVLAVSGVSTKKGPDGVKEVSQVQFYDHCGHHLRTLKVPGSGISGLAWEGGGLRIALAVESFIYFANIRPDYKWGYFGHTLAYAFNKHDRTDHCVVFFDTQTGQKHVKYVKKLMAVKGAGEYCVLATRTDDPGVFILILCNAIGAPVDSKYINIEPQNLFMTETHVVAASGDVICVWQYSSRVSKLTSIDSASDSVSLRKKDGKELVWHVDESPSNGTGGLDSNKNAHKNTRMTEDPISCVAASATMLLVGRESGMVQRYSLPHIALEHRYKLQCCPHQMAVNCDSTRFSVIDLNGVMTMFDLEAGKGREENDMGLPPGELVQGFERRDAWDMLWAEDNPELIAMMEKSRMYVFRGVSPEEPVLSSCYLCKFRDLTINTVLMDEIMAFPESPDLDFMVDFETKSLRDTRDIIGKVGLADASQFVEENAHPRLWGLLSEAALERLELMTAEKAFVKTGDYQGIQLVKRLSQYGDKKKQRAEVEVYFKRFDEAERIYRDMDRLDLAVDMRAKLGDWFTVKDMLLAQGAGDDDSMLANAHSSLGDYYFDRQLWGKALPWYIKANAVTKLVDCMYNLEDYDGLVDLVSHPEKQLPEHSPLLLSVGDKLASVGLAEQAVEAFVRGGDAKQAIDCCVLLNQWDQAISLAEQHDFPQIEGLLTKYASHLLEDGRKMEAIELYRKAGRHPLAAKHLAEIAHECVRTRANPMRARRLFVLAALEVEKFRAKTLNVQVGANTATTVGGKTVAGRTAAGGGGTVRNTNMTMATLDGLMQGDAAADDNKILNNAWRGVEAMELYIKAHEKLYAGQVDAAMKFAQPLEGYDDILDPVDIFSLIALTGFHNQMYGVCSNAFMRLEQLPDIPQERREQYQDLAFKIFTKFKPKNPAIGLDQQTKDVVTPEYLRDLRKAYIKKCI